MLRLVKEISGNKLLLLLFILDKH